MLITPLQSQGAHRIDEKLEIEASVMDKVKYAVLLNLIMPRLSFYWDMQD